MEEGVDVDDAFEVIEDNLIVDFSKIKVKTRVNNRYFENEGLYDNQTPIYREVVIPVKDPSLIQRLRDIINKFINDRKRKEFRLDMELDELDFQPSTSRQTQPEMMDPDIPAQQQNAGPVVLNALQGEEVTVPSVVMNDDFWIKNSTSDIVVDQKHASAMEIMAKNFVWSSSMNQGHKIFDMDLPGDALKGNYMHPAAMMFNQYAYWNGDIKVKIHINTTPFHIGKLIFSWYYAKYFDDRANDRENIANDVQLPNVCFNASEGMDVVLNIPYRNYRSMLCTRAKADDSLAFYMGTLTCRVFNPLTAQDKVEVDGYVHVSFNNSSFTGICPRVDVQPEMMPVNSLIKKAEGVLNMATIISNMDKPSNPAVPIMYTPQLSDSFATGMNDVTNVHALKLDPRGITQHPPGSSTNFSESNIKNIISKWGFMRTITWSNAFNSGYKLMTLPVSPELPFDQYYLVKIKVTTFWRSR